jgi:methionyl aminopeptidase
MIFYKTDEEIEKIRISCHLVCKTLAKVAEEIKPGVTGQYIDKLAEEFIRDHHGVPGFKGYRGFPATLCISPNAAVVHGIPTNRPFESGDVVSVDCGVKLDGFFGDAAFTFALGEVAPDALALMRVTLDSLYKGIDAAVAGARVGDVSFAVQDYCERVHKYGVVRELVGHGIGRNLHEDPEVPNYGKRGKGPIMRDGLVIAIEPMINLGRKEVRQLDDEWTIVTTDGKPSAHFEHTIAVKKNKADILSDHTYIFDAIKNNHFIATF